MNDLLVPLGQDLYELRHQTFYGEPVHIYVIEENDYLVIIDGPDSTPNTVKALKSFGKPLRIFLTHGPCARGAGELRQLIETMIAMYPEDLDNPWLNVSPTAITKIPSSPFPISERVLAIHTPGHSKGHACYYFVSDRKYLFTGDAVQGTRSGQIWDIYDPGTDWNTKRNLQSLQNLVDNYHFDAIMPFHYEIVWNDAHAKLKSELGRKSWK